MPEPLTDREKAYFDSIKQVAQSTRPEDLHLWRMTLDGKDVAVVLQRLLNASDGTEAGYQALALIPSDRVLERLRTVEGYQGEAIDPHDVEGPG